jgi:hypothetical protein
MNSEIIEIMIISTTIKFVEFKLSISHHKFLKSVLTPFHGLFENLVDAYQNSNVANSCSILLSVRKGFVN